MRISSEQFADVFASVVGRRPTREEEARINEVVADDQDLLLFILEDTELLSEHPAVRTALAALPSRTDLDRISTVFKRRMTIRSELAHKVGTMLRDALVPGEEKPDAATAAMNIDRMMRVHRALMTGDSSGAV